MMLIAAITLLLGLPGSPGKAADTLYSPSQITELISSGAAEPHGRAFAYSLGCRAFLWRKSADDLFFFITRNGKSFGEFCEEKFEKGTGKYLQIDEVYLTTAARIHPPEGSLPFVRKVTTYHWDKGVWVGTTVHWTLLVRDQDGTVVSYLKEGSETLSKTTATVVIPGGLLEAGQEYYLRVYKCTASEFDKAFQDCRAFEEGRGPELVYRKVVDNQCEIRGAWSTSKPDFLFILYRTIPKDPLDAWGGTRTKSIASMRRTTAIKQAEVIKFVADETK